MCIVLLCVNVYCAFVCKCVLYYCHRVSTQMHLTNISIRQRGRKRRRRKEGIKVGHNTKNAKKSRKVR